MKSGEEEELTWSTRGEAFLFSGSSSFLFAWLALWFRRRRRDGWPAKALLRFPCMLLRCPLVLPLFRVFSCWFLVFSPLFFSPVSGFSSGFSSRFSSPFQSNSPNFSSLFVSLPILLHSRRRQMVVKARGFVAGWVTRSFPGFCLSSSSLLGFFHLGILASGSSSLLGFLRLGILASWSPLVIPPFYRVWSVVTDGM